MTMNSNLIIGIPIGLWSQNEVKSYINIKKRLELKYNDLTVCAFSIQHPKYSSIEILSQQQDNLRNLTLVQMQAPIEGDYTLLDGVNRIKPFIDLCSSADFYGKKNLNIHVGITITNDTEARDYIENSENINKKCINNLIFLADYAAHKDVEISIENEPAIFVKHIDGVLQPVVFPYGSIGKLLTLISQANAPNVSLTFDYAHWAASLAAESFLSNPSLISDKYFPGQHIVNRLMNVLKLHDWNEFKLDQRTSSQILESALVLHLSNTQGIGVHLRSDQAHDWGKDGTLYGLIEIEHMKNALAYARLHMKPVIIEVDLNLIQPDFHEIIDFLEVFYTP